MLDLGEPASEGNQGKARSAQGTNWLGLAWGRQPSWSTDFKGEAEARRRLGELSGPDAELARETFPTGSRNVTRSMPCVQTCGLPPLLLTQDQPLLK